MFSINIAKMARAQIAMLLTCKLSPKHVRMCHKSKFLTEFEANYLPQERSGKTGKVSSFEPLPILGSAVPVPTYHEPEDAILLRIREAKNYKDLFRIVNTDLQHFQENHFSQAFRLVFKLQKDLDSCWTPEKLHKHPSFLELCQKLRKMAPMFTKSEHLITSLKALVFCKVTSESRIAKKLLFVIKDKINTLTLQEMKYLQFLLSKWEGPLVEALSIALPIVFETQLDAQLDGRDVQSAVEAFHYASSQKLPKAALKKISHHLTRSDSQRWTVQQTVSIFRSLRTIERVEEEDLGPLLQKTMQRLSTCVRECDKKDLMTVVAGSRLFGQNQNVGWYNEKLCHAIAERVLEEQWPLKSTLIVATSFELLGFAHSELLHYCAAQLVHSRCQDVNPFFVLQVFSSVNLKPEQSESIIGHLLNQLATKRFVSRSRYLVSLALNCAILGSYPAELIHKVFDESFLDAFLEETRVDHWHQIDSLQRAVKVECAQHAGPLPSDSFLDRLRRRTLVRPTGETPIRGALQLALGGANYVGHGMMTKLGHSIDHVVVLRPGGFPVAFNARHSDAETEQLYVEDISVPDGHQIIAVIALDKRNYVANGNRLRGLPALELRTLERAGYDVVAVNIDSWSQLKEFERIPFLMREIRSKESTVSRHFVHQ